MSDQEDEHFEIVDSGASETDSLLAGKIKKGSVIVIKDRPCKVMECTPLKTGKHGHAKTTLTAIDIFNGKKFEESFPNSHYVQVPFIKKTEWIVMSYDEEGYLTLMSQQGNIRQDLKFPNETEEDDQLSMRIREALDNKKELTIGITATMKEEKIMEMNEMRAE